MAAIEDLARSSGHKLAPLDMRSAIAIQPAQPTGYLTLLRLIFTGYRRRGVLSATLMITQSFLYNAIFFTYTLVLTKIYGVSASAAPIYLSRSQSGTWQARSPSADCSTPLAASR